MPVLEDIEKLVTPELLRRFAFEVGWARRGTDECLCPHCRAPLEFISEGPLARWRCCGKKAHGGGSLELVMIGRGLSAPDAQALLAGRVGLANYPAGLATRAREPEREPRPKRVKRGATTPPTVTRERPQRPAKVEPEHAAPPPLPPSAGPAGDLPELTSALRALIDALGARAAIRLEPLWGVAELGAFLKVSPKAVYALVAARHVPAVRIGRLLRFDPAEIRRWIDAQSLDKPPGRRALRRGV